MRHPLAVWAPVPESVRLVVDGTTYAMLQDDDDWWSPVEPVPVREGTRYGYLLDDDTELRPDPRSRRQPDGVHAASAWFDADGYAWGDGAWTGRQLAGGVIYELHVGTFTPDGTFDAAIERIPHLVGLGITHVELLPVNAFNGTHNWGYDGVFWYAVHETYGGPAGYLRFVDACHQAGLAVVQDVVYNHLGPSGNVLPRFGPYLKAEGGNSWGSHLNLDGVDSDEVRRYVIDNALHWLDTYHVDGLRLDAVHALEDSRALPILEELSTEVEARAAHVGRPLPLIAESDLNDARLITPREAHGNGLDAQWSDDFHHALHVALTGETTGYYEDFVGLGALAKVMERGFFHDGTLSTFRGRLHGRRIETHLTPGWRLVVFAQDHDQIGNRAAGDRLSATLSTDRLAVGAVLTLTSAMTPMLFMGEEWGASTPWQFFTSHPEHDLGEATAKGRIAEFARMGWDPTVVPDPQDPGTFTRSKLDWSEVDSGDHARLLALYSALTRLRRDERDLTDPRFPRVAVTVDDDLSTIVIRRGGLTVAANLGAAPATLPIAGELLLGTTEGVEAGPELVLPPDSAAIVRTP